MGRDQQLRVAIPHDIVEIRRIELRADANIVKTGILCRPAQFRIPQIVLEMDGDRIALLKPKTTEQLRHTIYVNDHFAVGNGTAPICHDERRALRVVCNIAAGMERNVRIDTGSPG